MKDLVANDLVTLRSLTTELLSTIDTWIEGADDPVDFRHRLVRAHAVAMLDDLEYLASNGPTARRGRPPMGSTRPAAARSYATVREHESAGACGAPASTGGGRHDDGE